MNRNAIDRRSFLKGSAAVTAFGIADIPEAAAISPAAPSVMQGNPDVAVVGAGAFGAWTSLVLRERGFKVVMIDEYGPASPRASSGGETRSIRAGYGSKALYSQWAIKALPMWEARQREFNRQIIFPNERIEFATEMIPFLVEQKAVFDKFNIPYEILNQAEMRKRFPMMNFDDVQVGFLEKKTSAVLMARESILAVADAFRKKGGIFQMATAMPGTASGRTLQTLKLNQGGSVSAAQFVFACGPWLRKVFPEMLGQKIATPRREVFFFGTPPGDDRFSWPNMPSWHDHHRGGYGFPSIERGLKYSPPGGGLIQQDPDMEERVASAYWMKRGHDYIDMRFPGMKAQPIVETRVCQTEDTTDGNFLIDKHPSFDNVWIAGGGSGHGFKHGPLLGEYIADRVTGKATDPATEKIFQLAGRGDYPPAPSE